MGFSLVLLHTSRCCFLSLRLFFLSLSLSPLFLVLFLILPCGHRCYCISLAPAVPQCSLCLADSLFVSLCFLPLSGFSSLSFCLASRPSPRFSFFSSLFASVTPSPCLLSLSLCVKRPAPLLFSSFLFLPLAPCLPAFLSGSVPHCPSLSPLCFSLSLSLSLLLSLALSLSLSLSLCLRLSGLLCLSPVLVPSSLCFCLSLGYSV